MTDVLSIRGMAVAFLQDSRWKGSRSRFIGNGYKLIYTDAFSGENTVAIVLSEEFQNTILEVKPFSDRLMRVSVVIDGVWTHLISTYDPQTRFSDWL